MFDPEIAKGVQEVSAGIKKVVGAMRQEMRRNEEPLPENGEETFPLRVCETNTVHYFTPQHIGHAETCPVCDGPLKRVRTVILS